MTLESLIRRLLLIVGMLVMLAASAMPLAAARDVVSYARVLDDASLVVRGQIIHLHGIFVPRSRFCSRNRLPAFCGTRAAEALDAKINRFVRCRPVAEYDDGSLAAFCSLRTGRFDEEEDLGGYLIGEGLALASPDAPFEYHSLERLAAVNRRGLWGFQADSIRIR